MNQIAFKYKCIGMLLGTLIAAFVGSAFLAHKRAVFLRERLEEQTRDYEEERKRLQQELEKTSALYQSMSGEGHLVPRSFEQGTPEGLSPDFWFEQIHSGPGDRRATPYRPEGVDFASFIDVFGAALGPPHERDLLNETALPGAHRWIMPREQSLDMAVDTEREKLGPEGGAFHVRIALQSSDIVPAERPPVFVHLVLDKSGSMEGSHLRAAQKAAIGLLHRLSPQDGFSLVSFSDSARVVVAPGPIGSRIHSIEQSILSIRAEGGTNLFAGLSLAYEQAKNAAAASRLQHPVSSVLVLSDGHTNMGEESPRALTKLAFDAFQNGIQTSSFGLESPEGSELLGALSREGAGTYYFVHNSEQLAPALFAELGKKLDLAATSVELRVRLSPSMELLKVYGSNAAGAEGMAYRPPAQRGESMRFLIPTFARNDAFALLLKIKAPASLGTADVGAVDLDYKDCAGRMHTIDNKTISIKFSANEPESKETANASVMRTIAAFESGETLLDAAARVALGDREVAAKHLLDREKELRTAAAELKDPLFIHDAERLRLFRMYAIGQSGTADPLSLSMLLETAGHRHLR